MTRSRLPGSSKAPDKTSNPRGAGSKPTCDCGRCKVCKSRVVSRRYRDRNRKKNRWTTHKPYRVVSDKELDRRALGLLNVP